MVEWPRHHANRTYLAAALLLTGAGFAIRAHGLEVDSLWLDEMLTRRSALGSLPALLALQDHPPLLYLLTRLSLLLGGDNAFALRFPSLLAGTLAIPVLYRLGRAVGYPRGGLWAAFLLALTPFHLRHAQAARHYALLLTLTAGSSLLLYCALKRPNWRLWFSFALVTALNLYLHYAALLVLLSQSILITLWLGYHLARGRRHQARYPAGAALLVALLYLPWLPRLLRALQANVSANGVTERGQEVVHSAGLWFRVAVASFHPPAPLLPYLLPLLFLGGMLALGSRQRGLGIGLIGTGLFVPLLLLYLFPISREPYPRYVLFVLPFYLLPAGVALGAIFRRLWQRQRRAWTITAPLLALLLLLLYAPLLRAEYDFVLNDWLSVRAYLRTGTAEEDLLLALSLEFPSGYNHVTASLPYYLEQDERPYTLLPGGTLSPATAQAVTEKRGEVWALFTSGGRPLPLTDPDIRLVPFQTDIYLAHDEEAPADPWAALVELYQALIPLAAAPAPQCFFQIDLAILYVARAHYDEAESALAAATAQCPERTRGERRDGLHYRLVEAHLAQEVEAGDESAARRLAHTLLALNSKAAPALEVLTAHNLLAAFQAGKARLSTAATPEPVAVHAFTMPADGDWGEALLIHPPAAVSYPLTLPEEPVALHTRLALAPQSWSWEGDGATFVVDLEVEGGAGQEVYRKHVANEPDAQRWHDVDLSLAPYAGETITLTLRTEAGPAGDPTGDWAGWETPRLLWEEPG